MLTRDEIDSADASDFDAIAQASWATLIRQYGGYSSQAYPDITGKLAEIANEAGVRAKQMVAALAKIEDIGAGTTKLSGGRDAINYDQERDRNEFISYGLRVMFESVQAATLPAFIFISDDC